MSEISRETIVVEKLSDMSDRALQEVAKQLVDIDPLLAEKIEKYISYEIMDRHLTGDQNKKEVENAS